MSTGAAFVILLGGVVGVAVTVGLRFAGFAVGHAVFPGEEVLRSGQFAIGVFAGAGGGVLAGGSVSLMLRRLLRRPGAALLVAVLIWAVVMGVDVAAGRGSSYLAPLMLGAITAALGLAMLPMAPRPLSDSI